MVCHVRTTRLKYKVDDEDDQKSIHFIADVLNAHYFGQ